MAGSETERSSDQPIITIRGDRVGLGRLRRDLLKTLHVRWGNDLAAGLMQGGVGFATNAHSQRFFEYNEPSIGLARKVGFREFGRAREAHLASGRYWDVLLFEMLHHEFTSPVLVDEFGFFRTEDEI